MYGSYTAGVAKLLVPSEFLLSNRLPTLEGWTAEVAVGLWLVIPTAGFEPTGVDSIRLETLRLNHSVTITPPPSLVKTEEEFATYILW